MGKTGGAHFHVRIEALTHFAPPCFKVFEDFEQILGLSPHPSRVSDFNINIVEFSG
jgi:hypothetical protein